MLEFELTLENELLLPEPPDELGPDMDEAELDGTTCPRTSPSGLRVTFLHGIPRVNAGQDVRICF